MSHVCNETIDGPIFSRGHTTLELAVSVGTSVGRYVGKIFDSQVVFALPLLPNRPRLDCRVSGLVSVVGGFPLLPTYEINRKNLKGPTFHINYKRISITVS